MQFIVKRDILLRSLNFVQGVVEKKNTLPILSNILIEAQSNYLTLSSTDMDISIVEKIKCNVEEEGATTINSQILYDIVRKLDDDCEIEIISNNGKLLTLRANGSRFSLASLPKEDFPIIETENENLNKLNYDIKNSKDISNNDRSKLLTFLEETKKTIPLLTNSQLLENETKIKIGEITQRIRNLNNMSILNI